MIESLIGFTALLALAFTGLPLAFSMLPVGTVGFMIERNLGAAFSMMGQQILDFSTNYSLTVFPLFVLMGTFIHHARMSGCRKRYIQTVSATSVGQGRPARFVSHLIRDH